MICNLILAHNGDGSVRALNLIIYIALFIYFVYLYSKKENNENK
jgi:hypothetical protein